MIVGVTGTRSQLATNQVLKLWDLAELFVPRMTQFHHGDCTGADALAFLTFSSVAWTQGRQDEIEWHCHPGLVNEAYRARTWNLRPGVQIVHPAKRPLTRDRIIAETADVLFAFPYTRHPTAGSGTWATIDFAANAGTPYEIYPPEREDYL